MTQVHPPLLIEEMTMDEFVAGLERTRTVIIPVGSVEEHGSHLPLSTDTIQAYEVAKRVAGKIRCFVAPPLHYGSCRSTSCHPGTISIRTSTLRALVKDVIRSCHQQGLRNFIILSGHAGGAHRMALQDAGEELLGALPEIRVAVVCDYDLVRSEGADFIETAGDSHAGEIETSRLLHSHPHLVKGESEAEYPSFPPYILVRDKRRFWPGGVWGDPTKATQEKGEKFEELVALRLATLVSMLEGFTD